MKQSQIKIQSYGRIESDVNTHIILEFGFYDIRKIDDEMISEFLDKKSKTLAYSSVKKLYDIFNASLKYAKSKGMLIANPTELVTKPISTSATFMDKQEDEDEELEIFTDDEIKRFVAAAQSKFSNGVPVYGKGNMFIFIQNTGIRIGEAAGLAWTKYDKEAQTVKIDSTLIQHKDKNGKHTISVQKHAKTKNSERTLKLNTKALACLPFSTKGKYIFCNRNGVLYRPRNIQNTLDYILQRADIPHKSTHVLRHTYASKLFEQGVDVKIVSELLGHTDVRTTYNIYITLIQKQKAKAMEAIEVMYWSTYPECREWCPNGGEGE